MNILRKASIRTKLSAAFGVAFMLVVAVGLFGLFQLHAVNSVTKEIREGWLPRIELLGKLKRQVAEHRLLASRRMQTTNFHHLATIASGMRAITVDMRAAEHAYQRAASTPAERALFLAFLDLWSDYEEALSHLVQRLELGEISAAQQDFDTTSLAAYEHAMGKLEALITHSREQSEAAAARAEAVYDMALRLTIAAIMFAAICALGAIVWSSRRISLPILRVSDAMRRLSAGDHSVDVALDRARTDEIGVLAAAATGYRESLLRSRELTVAAERERERLHAAVSNMPIGLAMFDSARRLIICNTRYGEIYGLPDALTRPGTSVEQILARRLKTGQIAGNDPEGYISELLDQVVGKRATARLVELNDGRSVSIIHQPMDGGGWVATHEDVTERRRAEERIQHMARHDALTDLPNRVLFKERVEEALRRVPRGEALAVLCLDLDRFKNVNDTLGHPAGDALLKMVASRLKDCARGSDTIARFGGDEFAIVQIGGEQPQAATILGQRVIDALGEPFTLDGQQVVIGCSIGIALAPADGDNADQLLKNGDMALYRVKSDGRGACRFFEPDMDARMQTRRLLELDLRKALRDGDFELHYQPVVNLDTNEVTSFEALLRWRHAERGMISPADFIPLAEEIGLIVPLGEWVLRQACLDAATWPASIKVAVNLSPAQFKSKRLLESVITALAVSKLPANRLELEITEGVLLDDHDTTLAILHQLRSFGVRIAMDDFGTGYSSLSYLRSFPFDKIKIDSSFIRNISDEESSVAIIRAVTGLSASLGMLTTAEGVETEEQLSRVRAEGCTEVQGFLFSAARPSTEVAALITALKKRSEAAA
jgi:diguanylate cyclase (GGDEF)-like protein